MAIEVITFDLDNTLWAVEPVLLRAEQVQQDWLREHRPGAVEAFDHEGLFEFKKSVWKRHPQLLHHVSQMRIQMLYELQLAAGYSDEEARSGAKQAFSAFSVRDCLILPGFDKKPFSAKTDGPIRNLRSTYCARTTQQ